MSTSRSRRTSKMLVIPAAAILALAACGGDSGGDAADETDDSTDSVADEADDEGADEPAESLELSFAHSYSTEHPHHVCGAEVVAATLADDGIDLQIFPSSQLGPDGPDRVSAVAAGDISVDIQGASAIAALYEPIGALDAAYVFDDIDHTFAFADSPAFEELRDDMLEATGVRMLDVWYFGMRHFTANQPIRTPDDLDGLRMRFPESPQYLQNAEAIGADATAVAFEEVYLSLQQGVIDGQENPIPNIADMNFDEVQSHISLSGHMTGFVVAIVGEDTWQSLSAEQQDAVQSAISGARAENRDCVAGAENDILAQWEADGTMTVVDDVDRAAFSSTAEAFFNDELDGDKLALYQAVRALSQQ